MFIVEKVEKNFYVLENMNDRTLIYVEYDKITQDLKVGDVVDFIKEQYVFNEYETIKRKEYMDNLTQGLWG